MRKGTFRWFYSENKSRQEALNLKWRRKRLTTFGTTPEFFEWQSEESLRPAAKTTTKKKKK